MNPQHEPQIEKYLDQLCRQLTKLPPEKQSEVRRETYAHLEAMVEANISDGSTPAEALDAALRQFGDATKIGRQIASECSGDAVRARQAKWIVRLCVVPLMYFAIHAVIWFISGIYELALNDNLGKSNILAGTGFAILWAILVWRTMLLRRWSCVLLVFGLSYGIYQYLTIVQRFDLLPSSRFYAMVMAAVFLIPVVTLRWRHLKPGI